VPQKVLFKNMLKKGKGTEFIIETIQLDPEIPAEIFSRENLRRQAEDRSRE